MHIENLLNDNNYLFLKNIRMMTISNFVPEEY